MSILKPLIDQLFTVRNVVSITDPQGILGVNSKNVGQGEVVAVALVVKDIGYQLVFIKGFNIPFKLTGETTHSSRFEKGVMEVAPSEEFLHSGIRFQRLSTDYTVKELFFVLMDPGYYRSQFSVLEFAPVRAVYKTERHSLREVFKGVEIIKDSQGVPYTPIAGMQLRPIKGEPIDAIPCEFGNLMAWMDDGTIHYVAFPDKGTELISVKRVFQIAKDYDAFIRFVKEFQPNGWEISDVGTLPLPEDPRNKPQEESKKTTGGWGEPAAPDKAQEVLKVLQDLLVTSSDGLSSEIMLALNAINHRFLKEGTASMEVHVMRQLEIAISEYFVILDGVGAKKRQEIKEGILAQVKKQLTGQ